MVGVGHPPPKKISFKSKLQNLIQLPLSKVPLEAKDLYKEATYGQDCQW